MEFGTASCLGRRRGRVSRAQGAVAPDPPNPLMPPSIAVVSSPQRHSRPGRRCEIGVPVFIGDVVFNNATIRVLPRPNVIGGISALARRDRVQRKGLIMGFQFKVRWSEIDGILVGRLVDDLVNRPPIWRANSRGR